MSKKPIHTIRDGACKVAIWKNEKPDGSGFWYEVTPGRTYTDNNDNPKTSHSFNKGDLLKTAELLRAAYHWIRKAEATDRAAETGAMAA